MNKFRTLTAREIECRVQQVTQSGLSLLLYKDARCDQAILDETVGAMNWQRHHNRDNKNCTVSIWDDEKKQWIEKEDTGTESNTEAEKGLASDSFKRACVNWGIGRELYTAPFIWITPENYELDNKGRVKTRFDVAAISYNNDREICGLTVVNAKTRKAVYKMGQNTSADENPTTTRNDAPTSEDKPLPPLMTNCAECKGVITPWIKDGVTKMSTRQIAESSINEYGMPLCLNCIKKRKAAK